MALVVESSVQAQSLLPKNLVPLDFKVVPSVPETHSWNLSDDSLSNDEVAELVPVIDLQDPNSHERIKKACETWGVFQLTNHGIPVALFDQVEVQTRRLFALPKEEKLRILRSPGSLTGYGSVPIGQSFQKQMWSEGFSMMGSPEEHIRQLLPDDYASFCDVMEKYQKHTRALSETLLELLLGSLGLTSEDVKWFKKNGGTKDQSLLHLNSYPECPDPTRALGMVPHTDSSVITLLFQGNISGLQVHLGDNGWVTVPPVAGALVVNLGDLLYILSNGRFKSILHRVIVNQAQQRVSAPFFYGPPREEKVGPASKLVDVDHPPLFRSVTWKEYQESRSNNFEKALDMLRLDPSKSSA